MGVSLLLRRSVSGHNPFGTWGVGRFGLLALVEVALVRVLLAVGWRWFRSLVAGCRLLSHAMSLLAAAFEMLRSCVVSLQLVWS